MTLEKEEKNTVSKSFTRGTPLRFPNLSSACPRVTVLPRPGGGGRRGGREEGAVRAPLPPTRAKQTRVRSPSSRRSGSRQAPATSLSSAPEPEPDLAPPFRPWGCSLRTLFQGRMQEKLWVPGAVGAGGWRGGEGGKVSREWRWLVGKGRLTNLISRGEKPSAPLPPPHPAPPSASAQIREGAVGGEVPARCWPPGRPCLLLPQKPRWET